MGLAQKYTHRPFNSKNTQREKEFQTVNPQALALIAQGLCYFQLAVCVTIVSWRHAGIAPSENLMRSGLLRGARVTYQFWTPRLVPLPP